MDDDDVDFITDAPIREPIQDRFSREPFAERIAKTIIAQRDPASLVVGVYGPWGDGKTSVLNLIEYSLAAADGIVSVRFNPWRLGNESEMFEGFFETLAEALDAKMATSKEKLGDALKSYGKLLRAIPSIGGGLADAAQAAGVALSETSLTKARARIEQILAKSGMRVVILMDDLDRLDKAEIQAIFRLVKVAADFEYTAYVLALDESVVAEALAERYSSGTSHGRSFMEKIIQLPLHLPPVSPDVLRRMTLETVELAIEQAGIDLSKSEAAEFAITFDSTVVPRITTPRMGKRYGNAVLFTLPMIANEVRTVDLLLIEAMRIFYPRLYGWVRTHEDEVVGQRAGVLDQGKTANEVIRSAVEGAAAGFTSAESKGAQVLLNKLFPRTESAWQSKEWPSEWDATWAKEKRIASKRYFRRYFAYTVPAGDVRDSDVDLLIAMFADPNSDAATTADLAQHLLDAGGPETLLQKLSMHVDDFTSPAAARLTLLLGAFSDVLPDESGFLGLSTMERAAILASKLVKRVAPEDRLEVVGVLMRTAKSVPFAVEILRWLQPRDDQSNALTTEDIGEAAREVLQRIIAIWEADDPFVVLGSGAAATLHIWLLYGDPAQMRECLAERIRDDFSDAFRLMGAFLGQAWSSETGIPLLPEFRREAYNAVIEYIDAADVFERLRERFGDTVGTGDFYGFRERLPEERLANEFAFIHRVVLGEQPIGSQPDATTDGVS